MINLLDKVFSDFENDLIYKSKCSIETFCKDKGIQLVEYFTYLENNPELQKIHNKSREIRQKLTEYILKNKLDDALISDIFLKYSIGQSGRQEEGASVSKLKFIKDFLMKTEIQSNNLEITILSNDL